jgi:uncharacterized protein YkwD
MRCCPDRPHRGALAVGVMLGAIAAPAALPVTQALAAGHKHPSPASQASRPSRPSRPRRPAARSATTCADANLVPTASDLPRIAAATLCLINQQRSAADLVALRSDAALNDAASQHSQDMVTKNYFDHVGPSGSTPQARLTAAGYVKPNHTWSIGENIAAATGSRSTPASIVTMWMNSAGHRANILDPSFRDTGIGAVAAVPKVVGRGAGGTYTEDFGVTS